MANGASTCDPAILLVDARRGVQRQTRRRSFIVSLLACRHVVVATDKMDLLDFSQSVHERIRDDPLELARALRFGDIRFIPLSALKGDSVVQRSTGTPWFDGVPLMKLLDTIEIAEDVNLADLRVPLQWANRPNRDFRGCSGTLAAGIPKIGDAVLPLPSRKTTRVKAIVGHDGDLEEAFRPQAISVIRENEIDTSCGDMPLGPGAGADA